MHCATVGFRASSAAMRDPAVVASVTMASKPRARAAAARRRASLRRFRRVPWLTLPVAGIGAGFVLIVIASASYMHPLRA